MSMHTDPHQTAPRVLWVRLSSLGDAVHCLPAINDLIACGLNVDVLTEKAFAPIFEAHGGVGTIHTTQLRLYKKKPIRAAIRTTIHAVQIRRALRRERYSAIIDSQGLWKSALLCTRLSPMVIGGAAHSVRENGVSHLYRQKINIDLSANVLARYRHIAHESARLLGVSNEILYPIIARPPIFYPTSSAATPTINAPAPPTVLLLHGVSAFREHKMLPVPHWQTIVTQLRAEGYRVLTLWHGPESGAEYRLAKLLEKSGAELIPPQSLAEIVSWMNGAATATLPRLHGVLSIDSGLGHLANACGLPTLMLFGPTSARRFSTAHTAWQSMLSVDFHCAPCGLRVCQRNLESGEKTPPCWATLAPEKITDTMLAMVKSHHKNAPHPG